MMGKLKELYTNHYEKVNTDLDINLQDLYCVIVLIITHLLYAIKNRNSNRGKIFTAGYNQGS